MRLLDSPNVDCLIDTTNCVGIGETLDETYDQLTIDHIRHIHFKNAAGTPSDFAVVPADEGFLDLEGLVRRLDEDDYQYYIGCEIFRPFYNYPEESMLRFKNWFDALDPVMDY